MVNFDLDHNATPPLLYKLASTGSESFSSIFNPKKIAYVICWPTTLAFKNKPMCIDFVLQ